MPGRASQDLKAMGRLHTALSVESMRAAYRTDFAGREKIVR